MEQPDDAPATRPRRESIGGVLGVGLGLLLICGIALSILSTPGGAIDAREAFAEWFEPAELPFGLAFEEASHLPGGERVIVLGREGASGLDRLPPPAPVGEKDDEEDGEDGEDGDAAEGADHSDAGDPAGDAATPDEEPEKAKKKKTDWSKVEVLEAGTPPARSVLVFHVTADAQKEFARRFRDIGFKRLEEIEDEGGRAVLESDRLAWHDFDVPFVHERLFEKGGTFRDSIRISLGMPGRYCVAWVFWPRGYPASKERAEELVGFFVPKERETDG